MTEKKRIIRRSLRPVFMTLLIPVIAAATIGCGQSSNLEQRSQTALDQLLSCTLQQTEDFDRAAAADQASIEAAAAEGTISMEKDGTEWKASQITLTMNETQNRKARLSDPEAEEIIHGFYQGDYEYTATTYYKMGTNSKTLVDEVEGKLISDPYQQYEQCVNTSEAQGIIEQYWYMQGENIVHNMKFSFTDKPDYWMTAETDIKGNVLYKRDDLSFVFAREEAVDGRTAYVYGAQYEEEFTEDYSNLPEEERNGFTKITIPYMVNLDYYIDPQAKEVVRVGMDYSEGIKAGEIANLMFSGMTREEAEKEVRENELMGFHRIILDIKNFNGEIKIDAPEDL